MLVYVQNIFPNIFVISYYSFYKFRPRENLITKEYIYDKKLSNICVNTVNLDSGLHRNFVSGRGGGGGNRFS